MTTAAGLRPLTLLPLPPGFFDVPPDPDAPEPLAISWPGSGGSFRLQGDAALQAAFRAALGAYEAAELAAARARLSGDVRGFFQNVTETHQRFAALEGFDLPASDLGRLQAQIRRRAAATARRERRTAPAAG